MSTRRSTGDPCPLDGKPLSMDKCQPCPYFRGASRVTGGQWEITCNWPRNGSAVDPNPAMTGIEEPAVPFAKDWWLKQW